MFFASLQVAAMGLSTLNVTARRFHIAPTLLSHRSHTAPMLPFMRARPGGLCQMDPV